MRTSLQREDIWYPELSYAIVGVLFDVHGQLGPRYQEKYYQRGIAAALRAQGIAFQEQVPIMLHISQGPIGRYFVDFVIDDKIVLEIKTVPRLLVSDFQQVDGYLSSLKMPLGILANFRGKDLIFKRILNPVFKP